MTDSFAMKIPMLEVSENSWPDYLSLLYRTNDRCACCGSMRLNLTERGRLDVSR